MWTLDSVKGIRPFVGATPATVEDSPVVRLVCAVLSSVWVGRPGPGRGGGDGVGRRGLAPSAPGTGLRDVLAVGGMCLLVGV